MAMVFLIMGMDWVCGVLDRARSPAPTGDYESQGGCIVAWAMSWYPLNHVRAVRVWTKCGWTVAPNSKNQNGCGPVGRDHSSCQDTTWTKTGWVEDPPVCARSATVRKPDRRAWELLGQDAVPVGERKNQGWEQPGPGQVTKSTSICMV